jgi:hypothetical protein
MGYATSVRFLPLTHFSGTRASHRKSPSPARGEGHPSQLQIRLLIFVTMNPIFIKLCSQSAEINKVGWDYYPTDNIREGKRYLPKT